MCCHQSELVVRNPVIFFRVSSAERAFLDGKTRGEGTVCCFLEPECTGDSRETETEGGRGSDARTLQIRDLMSSKLTALRQPEEPRTRQRKAGVTDPSYPFLARPIR